MTWAVLALLGIVATCTTVCPPMMSKLAKLQAALGDRFGKDVIFLSISVDPVNDTPPRLKQFADKYRARPGWHLLTGKKENVDCNEPRAHWKKVLSMGNTGAILQAIEEVADSK